MEESELASVISQNEANSLEELGNELIRRLLNLLKDISTKLLELCLKRPD